MPDKSRIRFFCSLVIILLVLVPVLQALPLNLPPLLPEASAQGNVNLSNHASNSTTLTSSPFQITLSSFNVGSNANRLLVVGVEANNQSVSSVTFGGVALARVAGSFHNQDTEFWYLKNPSGTQKIIVTMAGATQVVAGAYAFYGVDQANPIPTTATYFGSGNPSISLNTLYSNSTIVDSPSIFGGATLSTATCTSEWNINMAGKITGASSLTTKTTPGSVTCSWTASIGGEGWDDAAIEIKASGVNNPLTQIALNGKSTASGHVGNSSASITLYNFNAGTASNRLLVVGVAADYQSASSVKFGGVSLTQAVSSFTNNDAEFWYLKNPSSTPANLVVTMSGSTEPSAFVIGAYSLSGVNQTTPIPTTNSTHNTSAGSPSISLTTKYNNSWVLDLPSIFGSVTLSSPTCTQQWNSNVQYTSLHKITGASSSIIPATVGKVTCSWTASSGELYDDAAVEVSAETPSSWHSSTGILIPLYSYPLSAPNTLSSYWNATNNTKNQYPHVTIFAIANPNSGPVPFNPDYQTGIVHLSKSGTIVLGYIHTSYDNGGVSYNQAKTWINNWINWYSSKNSTMGNYGIKGIFIDEMSTNPTSGNLTYYQNLTSYIHNNSLQNLTYSTGNPGSDTSSKFLSQGTIDNLNIYEGANETYPFYNKLTNSSLQGNNQNGGPWHTQYDKSKFSLLVFNETTIPSQNWVNGKSVYAGLMYLTDNTGCGTNPSHPTSWCAPFNSTDPNKCTAAENFAWCLNPWNTTSSYLSTLAGYLSKTPVLSTIQAQDTSGNVKSTLIQIYQSGNLIANQTTPFTYNSTSGFQFKFNGTNICSWSGSASSSTKNLVVAPTSSGTYIAIYSTSC